MGDQALLDKNKKNLLYDPMIIPRVKQYLEENVHKTYVDVSDMARVLQERYREYGRRKMAPFRQLVEQAYKIVLHSYGLDSNPSSDDNEESDLEFMDDRVGEGNHVNNMLTDMYAKGVPKKSLANDVAINISSDESDNDDEIPHKISSKSEKASHPSSVNVNQVTITKVANLPPSPPPTSISSLNQNTQHIAKKRKVTEDNVPTTDNRAKRQTMEKPANIQANTIANIPSKTAKKFKREITIQKSKIKFSDIGGMKKILKELCELLLHIKHPEVYRHIGLPPHKGVLLHGPPGSGKTLLAQAIAGQLDVGLIHIAATELIAGVSGESEERIRELFEQAAAAAPCVLFIDEIDAISSNRMNAQKDMERRIVAQLLSSLDALSQCDKGDQVLIIGATNRADALDPALRRVGRFDQEICLGIPDRNDRSDILKVICSRLSMEYPMDYDGLAALTPGYVGADLLALASRAASIAVKRVFNAKEQKLTKSLPQISENEKMDVDEITPKISVEEENVVKENGQGQDNQKNQVCNSPANKKDDAIDITTETMVEDKEKGVIEIDEPQVDDNVQEYDGKNDQSNLNSEATTTTNDTTATEQKTKDSVTENNTNDVNEQNMDDDEIIEVIEEDVQIGKNSIYQMSLDKLMTWLTNSKPLLSSDELDDLCITKADFLEAIKVVQPSAKREGFITVPDVTWDNIGSLRDIREELQLAVLAPVKFPEKLESLGLQIPSGVLLCGPPGCGKTLLAKAVANEAGINFISVKGPELLNMYVGESERAVRQCFQRARNSTPCVIFFDEFDSLCPKRSDSGENNGTARVVNQLLTEMDGIEDRKGVFLMAATNRPDIVDPAVLRPGRLDKILYVGLPELSDRVEILQALTKEKPVLADDVDINNLAIQTDNYTGADLAGLVRQASLYALKESISLPESTDKIKVSNSNFIDALKNIKPSVSEQDKRHYEKLRQKYSVTSYVTNNV